MSGLAKFFPNSTNLLKKGGEVPYTSLAGKTVFLYFSASWCPSCKGFTPQLMEFYENHAKDKNFEVIWVSWDEEEDDYKEYFDKMPWLALPFADRQDKEALSKQFDVQTIPTLVELNADSGDVLTTKARMKVVNDPEGKDFPWHD